jgi:transposase
MGPDKDQSWNGHMNSRTSTIEVVTRAERRRFGSEEKLAIVRETLAPGASVGAVARRHGLSVGLVYTWRKRALAGVLAGFVPVEVEGVEPDGIVASGAALPGPAASDVAPGRPARFESAGMIEIELPNGWRVRVGGDADTGALRRVFSVLGAVCG